MTDIISYTYFVEMHIFGRKSISSSLSRWSISLTHHTSSFLGFSIIIETEMLANTEKSVEGFSRFIQTEERVIKDMR